MKGTTFLIFLLAGSFLGSVLSADSQPKKQCGCGMRAAGCACNQVCNHPKYYCKMICKETLDYCACLEGYSLPYPEANYCVRDDKCPPPKPDEQ